MKNNNLLIWILGVGLIVILLYTAIRIIFFVSFVEKVEEPQYYKSLFNKKGGIINIDSEIRKKSSVISVYNYNNYQQGILVFRKKVSNKDLNKLIEIKDKKTSMSGKTFKGSIFKSSLRYSFNQDSIVNKIEIVGKNLDDNIIKKKTEKLFYLELKPENNISIYLNSEQVVFSKNHSTGDIVKDHIMFLIIDNYVYLLYSKPLFKNKGKDFDLIDILDDNILNLR